VSRNVLRPSIDDKKVLHVGNIAQNAYWNALTLNSLGYQSDVLIHDLYHFASSPCWLNLSKNGVKQSQLEDDYYPNFFAFPEALDATLDFVAQGPIHAAAGYLILRRTCASAATVSAAWDALTYWRFKAIVTKSPAVWSVWWSDDEFERVLREWNLAEEYLPLLRRGREAERLQLDLNGLLELVHGKNVAQGASHFLDPCYVDSLFREFSRRSGYSSPEKLQVKSQDAEFVVKLAARVKSLRQCQLSFAYTAELIEPFVPQTVPPQPYISEEDAGWFVGVYSLWRKLFECYRYRVAYSNAGIFANLVGAYPYAAYEHGTIRDIPFQDNMMGRLTRAAYLNATSVLITNADYTIAKKRIEFPVEVLTYCPHGFDHEKADLFLSQLDVARIERRPVVTFVAPARHTWDENEPGNEKGNDVIVRAVAAVRSVVGPCFRVIFVEYGVSVNKTKSLIAELNVGDVCEWLLPLPTLDLWRLYKSCHAVVDQFSIPAIGAIGVEALALGCRLITRDEGALQEFFGEIPPLYAACTASEVSDAMLKVINDPEDVAGVGIGARVWFQRRHGPESVLRAFDYSFNRLDDEYAVASVEVPSTDWWRRLKNFISI
jgi:glycosyltransferase involved in cell wall biosynthesis